MHEEFTKLSLQSHNIIVYILPSLPNLIRFEQK